MEIKKTLAFALLYGFVSASLSIAIPLYLDFIGYSLSGMGVLLGAAALLSSLLGIVLAGLGDRFGRKILLSLYPAVTAIGTGIIAFILYAPATVLGKAFLDFSGNNLWNALLARLSDLSKKENRAALVGTYIAAFALAYSVSQFLAGSVINSMGFTAIFALAILAAILMSLLALLFVEVGRRKHRFHLSLNILRTRDGLLNAIVSFFTGSTSIIYAYVMYLFFKYHFGMDAAQTGFFIAATFILWSASSFLLGPYIDRHGIKRIILLGALLNGGAWIAAIFLQDFWPFILIMALDNLTWPLYGLSTAKLSSIIPEEENIGRDISIFGFAHMLGVTFAAFAGGFLAEMSFSYVFAARAIFVLAGASIVFFLMKLKD
ncbi:MAG: MFS transporter [Candidatus Micrarchaeota archaeon]